MSKQAVEEVVARLVSDETFRKQMQSDLEAALHGYDLTPEEKMALAQQDAPGEATALDDRKSKSAIAHQTPIPVKMQ